MDEFRWEKCGNFQENVQRSGVLVDNLDPNEMPGEVHAITGTGTLSPGSMQPAAYSKKKALTC